MTQTLKSKSTGKTYEVHLGSIYFEVFDNGSKVQVAELPQDCQTFEPPSEPIIDEEGTAAVPIGFSTEEFEEIEEELDDADAKKAKKPKKK
jgi:hypothetical protein